MFSLIRELGDISDEEELEAVRVGFQATCDAFGFIINSKLQAESAPEQVQILAQQRWDAKQAKDWSTADQLREEILALGWTVKDGKDGFVLAKA